MNVCEPRPPFTEVMTKNWRRLWHRHVPPEHAVNPAAAVLKSPAVIAEWYVRPRRLARNVEHVAGPLHVDIHPDEVVGLTVLRNAAIHVDGWIKHHLSLGVRHLVLLDSGSTDDTIDRASRHQDVTVLRTSLPYRRYEVVMKRYLARRFARNRWLLFIDADERFEYPFADRVPLRS